MNYPRDEYSPHEIIMFDESSLEKLRMMATKGRITDQWTLNRFLTMKDPPTSHIYL